MYNSIVPSRRSFQKRVSTVGSTGVFIKIPTIEIGDLAGASLWPSISIGERVSLQLPRGEYGSSCICIFRSRVAPCLFESSHFCLERYQRSRFYVYFISLRIFHFGNFPTMYCFLVANVSPSRTEHGVMTPNPRLPRGF